MHRKDTMIEKHNKIENYNREKINLYPNKPQVSRFVQLLEQRQVHNWQKHHGRFHTSSEPAIISSASACSSLIHCSPSLSHQTHFAQSPFASKKIHKNTNFWYGYFKNFKKMIWKTKKRIAGCPNKQLYYPYTELLYVLKIFCRKLNDWLRCESLHIFCAVYAWWIMDEDENDLVSCGSRVGGSRGWGTGYIWRSRSKGLLVTFTVGFEGGMENHGPLLDFQWAVPRADFSFSFFYQFFLSLKIWLFSICPLNISRFNTFKVSFKENFHWSLSYDFVAVWS